MINRILVLALIGYTLVPTRGLACTDIVVGKEASIDGSVITSHTGAAPDCRVHRRYPEFDRYSEQRD